MTNLAELDIDVCELPASLQELVELIGFSATMELVKWRGGTAVHIPHRPGADNAISQRIGLESTQKLARQYGGDMLDVARGVNALRCLRNREIVQSYDDGVSANDLALKYSLTRRQIFNILDTPLPEEKDPAQLKLPF